MNAEKLLLDNTIKNVIKSESDKNKRTKQPEQILCDVLNRLTREQRIMINEMMR